MSPLYTTLSRAPFSPSRLFRAMEQGLWYDPSDLTADKIAWRRNLLTESEFRNGVTDAPARAGLVSATSFPEVANNTGLAFGHDGVTSSYAYKNYSGYVVGTTYTLSFLIRMTDNGVPVVGGSTSTGDFRVLVNGATVPPSDCTVIALGDGLYKVTARLTATSTIVGTGVLKYNTQSSRTFSTSGWMLEVGSTATEYQKITDFNSDFLAAYPHHTLYQDAAGTTPVSALGQPVGLILDKRLGLVLGPEILANGDFSAGSTGWTNPDTAPSITTFSGGAATMTAAAGGPRARLRQSLTLTAGTYLVSVNVVGVTGTPADGNLAIGNTLSGDLTYGSIDCRTVGLKTRLVHISGPTLGLAFTTSSASGAVIVIDNVSVKLLPGNHATQSTAASRPTVEALVNLLTYSEQFDNAAWIKTRASILANNTLSPRGDASADKLVEDTTASSTHHASEYAQFTLGFNYTFSVYMKAAERGWCWLSCGSTAFGTTRGAYFDISTGQVGGVSAGVTARIESVGDGWYRCSIDRAATATGSGSLFVMLAAGDGVANYSGDGTSGIYVWGADIRLTSDSIYPYQRVNTATDYADVGAPRYLQFDGTDDGMVTNSIDFTGTDKMTVWAGAKANSAAANSVLFELSNVFGAGNPGSMAVMWPRLPYAVNFGLAGTGAASRSTSAAADTGLRVISCAFDISKALTVDEINPRVNGAGPSLLTVDAGPAGTGNYGNYPLYIGRRAGTTLPFNGRLYGLIIRGAASDADQIVTTESWMNSKTRAY